MSIGQHQREFLHAIAAKLERGEPLNALEREWTAGAVRAFADQIPDEPKRGRGKPPKLDAPLIWFRFHLLRRDNVTREDAIAQLADEFNDGKEDAIKSILKKSR